MAGQLKWDHTRNDSYLSVYTSGPYRIEGLGRTVGKKFVRDWVVTFNNKVLDTPLRLAECKDEAEKHAFERAREVHVTLTLDEASALLGTAMRSPESSRPAERATEKLEAAITAVRVKLDDQA